MGAMLSEAERGRTNWEWIGHELVLVVGRGGLERYPKYVGRRVAAV